MIITVFCLNPRPDQKVIVMDQQLILPLSSPKLKRRLPSFRTEMKWCILTAHWLVLVIFIVCWHVVLVVLPRMITDWLVFWLTKFQTCNSSNFQVSLLRVEILDSYFVDERTKLLFFSLSERWGFVGRCRQARLLCLGPWLMSVPLNKNSSNIFSMMIEWLMAWVLKFQL